MSLREKLGLKLLHQLDPEGTLSWEAFVAGTTPAETLECSGDEIAFWLYSSGSTGAP